MVLAWENLQEVSVMLVVVVVLPHWRLFTHCFSTSSLTPHPSVSYRRVFTPILYFQSSSSQSDSRHFHFNLPGFFCRSLTASATVLRGRSLPTGAFYFALLPHILACFCDSDGGRKTPSKILLCACPDKVVPSG